MSISPSVESITHARATRVWFADDLLYVLLEDGRELGVPLIYFPRLDAATPEQQGHWEINGHGTGVYWPDIDEDLSVAGLLGALEEYRPSTRLITSSPATAKQLKVALQPTQSDKSDSTKSSASRGNGPLTLSNIGILLSLFAGSGVPLYILGLAVFERQLEPAMGMNSVKAWEEASLVPKTTVIVQALDALLSQSSLRLTIGAVISTIFLLISVKFLAQFLYSNNRKRVLLYASAAFAVYVVIGVYSLRVSTINTSGPLTAISIELTLYLLSGLAISFGAFAPFWKSSNRWWERWTTRLPRPFLLAISLAYLGSLINAYYSYPLQKNVLPTITITNTSNQVIRGSLITHLDGYWYVLDTSSKRRGVTPIRDNQATSITLNGS